MALTNIGDRLTPSIPIEQTFDAQQVAAGTKITTLIGHAALNPPNEPNQVYDVVNIGDADAAQKEVDAVAGAGSGIGLAAKAFINANALAGRSTFPQFRVLVLDAADTGVAGDALELLKHLRSDMIVSCYPVTDAATNALLDLATYISGPDRDLQGQFGTFVTAASLDSVSDVQKYNFNDRRLIIASLPDTSGGLTSVHGDVTQGSPVIANIDATTGLQINAKVSCASFASTDLRVIAYDYAAKTLTVNDNATATTTNVLANVFTSGAAQPVGIVAAAHAGAMMASQFPYNPLKGVVIGGLIPPSKMSDRVQIDPNGSSEALLRAGVSPLYVQPGNKVAFIKTRTSYRLQPDGVTEVRDYNAWQQLVTINDFVEELYQVCQNPPFNNNPGGTKATVSVANALLGEMGRLALSFEDQGAFQGVKSLIKLFQVAPSTVRRGRFDFKLPINVLPDLDVIAINVVATTMFDFTI